MNIIAKYKDNRKDWLTIREMLSHVIKCSCIDNKSTSNYGINEPLSPITIITNEYLTLIALVSSTMNSQTKIKGELPHGFTFDNIARSEKKLYELYSIWYDRCSIQQIMSFIFRFNLPFDVFKSFIKQKFKKENETRTESKEKNQKFLSNVYKLATIFGGKRYTNDTNSLDNENVEAAGVRPIINTQQSKENGKNTNSRNDKKISK